MIFPENCKFSRTHRWVEKVGESYTVGFTPFLQEELGDITFIDLPEVGETVVADDSFMSVEAAKAVTELSLPISGKIEAVHEALSDAPELLNEADVKKTWLVTLTDVPKKEYLALMDAAEYEAFLAAE
ncbi:glycine cleavage system protein GcvH [Isobaculum melis]|uniref:Glycine cleavage system H protein n=1 Tax=Isobaculum melis TaxID=142588 RepID=A0A1H9PZL9_9LACT|nr:glycine cleavage system protein GcvH [Isobaculum melis]SER53681.1 glycine cleavage system H protein [Isobaculum melis]